MRSSLLLLFFGYAALIGSCAPARGSGAMGGGSDGSIAVDHGLTAAEVTDLPGGNASGSGFTGSYLTADPAVQVGCTCRRGECGGATGTLSTDGVWLLTQDGGQLEIYMRGGINTRCTGGIDADGSFWCGKARGDSESGESLLLEGTVSHRDGVDIIAVDAQVTTTSPTFDCDLRATGSLSK